MPRMTTDAPCSGEKSPHADAWEAEWDEGERIATDLEERGFVCGSPSHEDVAGVVRALIRAGHLARNGEPS